jgi:hypothetical protein
VAHDEGLAMVSDVTGNGAAGSYTVLATSAYGTVGFSLTNSAAGVPAAIRASGPTRQSAVVGRRFRRRLAARVTDPFGKPVQNAPVTFSLATAAASGPTASFLGGGQATGTTDADGVAIPPPLLAGDTTGRYAATASTDGLAAVATYRPQNVAGAPHSITAALGSGESTPLGARFPIPLAVTVEDRNGNPMHPTDELERLTVCPEVRTGRARTSSRSPCVRPHCVLLELSPVSPGGSSGTK